MALICMAVWDTEENQRSNCTYETIACLFRTVDLRKHRLVIIDNDSCEQTFDHYREWKCRFQFDVIHLGENIGQAKALNRGLQLRVPGEFVVRMDNDVIIHQNNWIEDMEYVIEKDPMVAIVGLKRRDAWERPDHETPWWRSKLKLLPHEEGDRWMVIEVAESIMGTCQGLNPAFLDKVGYFYQPKLYGFEDALMATRAHVLNYKTCFLPHIVIDHLDSDKSSPYGKWKDVHANACFPEFEAEKQRIIDTKEVYHGPE